MPGGGISMLNGLFSRLKLIVTFGFQYISIKAKTKCT